MIYHDGVSTLEVKRVEAALKFVEVLGDLHVLVRWQPVPGGGDKIGKISCRILTENQTLLSHMFGVSNIFYD